MKVTHVEQQRRKDEAEKVRRNHRTENPDFYEPVLKSLPLYNKQSNPITVSQRQKDLHQKFYITKINNDYYFDSKKLLILNEEAQYIKIFDLVLTLLPNGGVTNYKEIVELGRKRKIRLQKRSIQRALTGTTANLYKYVKTIPYCKPDGEPFFIAKPDGKRLEFLNKK